MWFELAGTEKEGIAEAQYEAGHMYYDGLGTTQDKEAAAQWFRLAADQGLAKAQYQLGLMYYLGKGVPQDYMTGHLWANLAAAKDFEKADELKKSLEEKMSPEQIAEAQRMAREWKPKASQK